MQETIERYRSQVKDVQTDTSSVEDVQVHKLLNHIQLWSIIFRSSINLAFHAFFCIQLNLQHLKQETAIMAKKVELLEVAKRCNFNLFLDHLHIYIKDEDATYNVHKIFINIYIAYILFWRYHWLKRKINWVILILWLL